MNTIFSSKKQHQDINIRSLSVRPIWLFIASYTDLPVLSILSERLTKRAEKVQIVLTSNQAEHVLKIKHFFPALEDNQLVILDEYDVQDTKVSWFQLRSFRKWIQQFKYQDFNLATFKAHYLAFSKEILLARKAMQEALPKLLIVGEDGVSGPAALIRAALDLSIPVLDVPYGYGSQEDFNNALLQKTAADDCFDSKQGLGSFIKEHFPHWVKKGKFAGRLLYNPNYLLVREALKLSIDNPWTVHGGFAYKLAVESQQMFDHYIKEGVNPEKLSLTGTVYCDLVSSVLQSDNKLQSAYESSKKIEDNQTSILLCWPPSYHGSREQLCEFSSYEALTKAVLEFLSSFKDVSLTISLHPAVSAEFATMVRSYPVTVSEEYIIKLIPAHDIYISCFSSTIRWAIAAAKPVVNYDFYNFKLKDYKEAKAVHTLTDWSDFQKTIQQLVQDEVAYKAAAMQQKADSAYWGSLDNKNSDRIFELIEKMLQQKNSPTKEQNLDRYKLHHWLSDLKKQRVTA